MTIEEEAVLNRAIENRANSMTKEYLREFVIEDITDFFWPPKGGYVPGEDEVNDFIAEYGAKTEEDPLSNAIKIRANSMTKEDLEIYVIEDITDFFWPPEGGYVPGMDEVNDFIAEYDPKIGLAAKKKQVLEFISGGTLLLTEDQVSTPEEPNQQEVIGLMSNITTPKELMNFISSTTFASGDEKVLNRQRVVELLNTMKLEASSATTPKDSHQAGNKKASDAGKKM